MAVDDANHFGLCQLPKGCPLCGVSGHERDPFLHLDARGGPGEPDTDLPRLVGDEPRAWIASLGGEPSLSLRQNAFPDLVDALFPGNPPGRGEEACLSEQGEPVGLVDAPGLFPIVRGEDVPAILDMGGEVPPDCEQGPGRQLKDYRDGVSVPQRPEQRIGSVPSTVPTEGFVTESLLRTNLPGQSGRLVRIAEREVPTLVPLGLPYIGMAREGLKLDSPFRGFILSLQAR